MMVLGARSCSRPRAAAIDARRGRGDQREVVEVDAGVEVKDSAARLVDTLVDLAQLAIERVLGDAADPCVFLGGASAKTSLRVSVRSALPLAGIAPSAAS
jgi:hypothetical protein